MAKSTFNLQNFKSSVLTYGVARPTRFEVEITYPPCLNTPRRDNQITVNSTRLMNLYCENAVLPQLNISVAPQRIHGPNYQNPIASDFGGEAITLSFLVDTRMTVKNFFESWMKCIVDPYTFNVAYQKDPDKGYISPIAIKQLDEQDNVTYAIELRDAFPRNIGIMDLNSAALNTPHKLNVTFAYRFWRQTYPINEKAGEQNKNADITIASAAKRAIDLGIAT